MKPRHGWYSAKQKLLAGTAVYELIGSVSAEALVNFNWPIEISGRRAVHVTEVTVDKATHSIWPDLVYVGEIGEFIRAGDAPGIGMIEFNQVPIVHVADCEPDGCSPWCTPGGAEPVCPEEGPGDER